MEEELLDDDDVLLLPDILFEVEYAELPDKPPRDTTVEPDEETVPVLNDETGTGEKMMPVDDGGMLVMSAMEDTGKPEMEILCGVAGVSVMVVTHDDAGEVGSAVV